ncbi:4Fe-4S binding protein [Thermodesulfobacteriota bacterium]
MYRLIPIVLVFIVSGAHFLRSGAYGITLMCLTAPLALLIKRKWIVNVFSILLVFFAYDWGSTAYDFWAKRVEKGIPATRMLIILSVVALVCLASILVFKTKKMKERYAGNADKSLPGTFAFFITFIALLYVAIFVTDTKVMLFEHFVFASGVLEAFWLAIYAGFFVDYMQNYFGAQYLRSKIWILFSTLFFFQIALVLFLQYGMSLFGLENFLVTGTISTPVPMTIIAEPIFNNSGLIALIIFAVTIILVGPAWCSYLCYFGAVDHLASCKEKKPGTMPKWRNSMRYGILAAVLVVAAALRFFEAPAIVAISLAALFGIVGIGVIWSWSRKSGVMTYCTAYCPVGTVATLLGKLSPFRVRIDDACDACGDCTSLCRYDALTKSALENKEPGGSCTLCGDCVAACEKESIDFRFLSLSPRRARTLFIVIVVSLHAILLGITRM